MRPNRPLSREEIAEWEDKFDVHYSEGTEEGVVFETYSRPFSLDSHPDEPPYLEVEVFWSEKGLRLLKVDTEPEAQYLYSYMIRLLTTDEKFSEEALQWGMEQSRAEKELQLVQTRLSLSDGRHSAFMTASNYGDKSIYILSPDQQLYLTSPSEVDTFIDTVDKQEGYNRHTASTNFRKAYNLLPLVRSALDSLPGYESAGVTLVFKGHGTDFGWAVQETPSPALNIGGPRLFVNEGEVRYIASRIKEQLENGKAPEVTAAPRVINLTNEDVVILQPNKAPAFYPKATVVRELNITFEQGFEIDGVPVMVEKHPNQAQFPPSQANIFYLVDHTTYSAMPFRRDFVTLGQKLTDADGTVWGYRSLIGHAR